MNFDLKEMYRYLISHTLPGLLLLVEILFFFYPAYSHIINKALTILNPAILILAGYAFSTLLGTMLDGIRHFIFDFFVDSCSKDCCRWIGLKYGFSKWIYQKFNILREENKRINKGNFTAFKNNSKDKNECMEVYKHFIEFSEEAIWYPYEAYANISVALLFGLILLWGMFSLKFWLIYVIVLMTLSFEAVLIYKFCSDDQEEFFEIYKDK